MEESKLLEYFMERTDKRFDSIETKLDDHQKFRVEWMASARTSIIILSCIWGGLATLASLFVAYHTR